jgi:hypothetical protein
MVKWVVISRLAGPWLTVGKVNGGAPSDKVALADRASVSKVLSANQQKADVCVSLEYVECMFPWCTAQPCLSNVLFVSYKMSFI